MPTSNGRHVLYRYRRTSESKLVICRNSAESIKCLLTRRRALSLSTSIWGVLTFRVLPSRWSRTLIQTVFCARSSPALWISISGIVIVAIGHTLLHGYVLLVVAFATAH